MSGKKSEILPPLHNRERNETQQATVLSNMMMGRGVSGTKPKDLSRTTFNSCGRS